MKLLANMYWRNVTRNLERIRKKCGCDGPCTRLLSIKFEPPEKYSFITRNKFPSGDSFIKHIGETNDTRHLTYYLAHLEEHVLPFIVEAFSDEIICAVEDIKLLTEFLLHVYDISKTDVQEITDWMVSFVGVPVCPVTYLIEPAPCGPMSMELLSLKDALDIEYSTYVCMDKLPLNTTIYCVHNDTNKYPADIVAVSETLGLGIYYVPEEEIDLVADDGRITSKEVKDFQSLIDRLDKDQITEYLITRMHDNQIREMLNTLR